MLWWIHATFLRWLAVSEFLTQSMYFSWVFKIIPGILCLNKGLNTWKNIKQFQWFFKKIETLYPLLTNTHSHLHKIHTSWRCNFIQPAILLHIPTADAIPPTPAGPGILPDTAAAWAAAAACALATCCFIWWWHCLKSNT